MKILYASSSTAPSRTANSVHVMKMCQAMAKAGHEVKLITLGREEIEEKGVSDVHKHYGVDPIFDVERIPFPSHPARQLVFALSVRKYVKKWKPDLVFGRYFPVMALLGLLGYPLVWESHERVWDRSILAKFLAKRLFAASGFKRLVVISEALKQMYVDAGMITGDRILVAHDAADCVDIEECGEEDGFRAGYIGGVYAGRGIELVIECSRQLPDIEFHFVGGTKDEVMKLVDESLPDNVVFHGYQPPEKVPQLRDSFDVLLAPYQRKVAVWGGGDTSAFMSPLKIFEYMASQRPMICSDLPVLREVLNEKNAILAPPEDTDAWVTALEELRDSKELRTRIAMQAFSDFETHYTWDIRAERVLAGIEV